MVLIVLLFVLQATCLKVSINADLSTGAYTLLVNNKEWLASGEYALRANNQWYSTSNKTLTLAHASQSTGMDIFGRYNETVFQWKIQNLPSIGWQTSIKEYSDEDVGVVFTQYFPTGLSGTQSGDNTEVVAGFPTFSTDMTNLHYLTYVSTFAYPHLGTWNKPNFPGGANGGVPVAFFDSQLNTVVMSPLTHFMVGIQTQSKALKGQLACGIQGKVESVPTGYTHSTIISGSTGVNAAFKLWGSNLLKYSGKKAKVVDDDYTVKHLGYWTDNGAYYYYLTEPGKNYADTMVDVAKYVESTKLPIKYYQFDSWWYYKGQTGGLILWEPTPDIFPTGMKDVQQKMGGWPLVLHNRWFEQDNDYSNKMHFPFVTEKTMALPLTEETYLYLMSKAKEWGMIVYEQDWLVDQYLKMEATQTNITNAENWMMNMNNAAYRLGLTIQLCMPLPMHVLQSSAMNAVTHIRASTDYQRTANSQWQIGTTSMLHHALGVFPFKDNFWSNTAVESGCHLPSTCYDWNAVLGAIVSTLSCGPVAPADKIGFLDTKVVMSTCRSDGVLLKPDVPATTMDLVYSLSFSVSVPEIYQLTSTYSTHNANWNSSPRNITFYYVLAAETSRSITVTPSDLGDRSNNNYVAFEHGNAATLTPVNAANPLHIPALVNVNQSVNFRYYVVAPTSSNGQSFSYALLGESDKYVHASTMRFKNFSFASASSWKVSLVGGPNESLSLQVYHVSSKQVVNVKCTLDNAGNGVLQCADGSGCSC